MTPGIRYITKEQAKLINEAIAQQQKLITAHRWLSEFDRLLQPMWCYLLKDDVRDIAQIREDMRRLDYGAKK